jgi:hypothetical protein
MACIADWKRKENVTNVKAQKHLMRCIRINLWFAVLLNWIPASLDFLVAENANR